MGKKDTHINRRDALRTIGACGIGAGSIGVMSGMTRAAEFETVSLPDIPTEPEKGDVYSFVGNKRSWPGDYEISHTMEWFRTVYNSSDNWVHDFSIQSHACSQHSEYDTLIPECTGWGYRIELPQEDGYLLPYVNEEMHGVNPGGTTGNAPEWTDVVMEGALGTLNTPASILYTAEELRNIMDPADGFDTSLDNGFRWLNTYDYGDGTEQVSSHHRVQLESSTTAPMIETNATVRIHHDPTGDDKWLDMIVRAIPAGALKKPEPATESISTAQSSTDVHPEDMSREEIERLGIKKVEEVDVSSVASNHRSSVEQLKVEEPEYVITNCPWSGDGKAMISEENREPTT